MTRIVFPDQPLPLPSRAVISHGLAHIFICHVFCTLYFTHTHTQLNFQSLFWMVFSCQELTHHYLQIISDVFGRLHEEFLKDSREVSSATDSTCSTISHTCSPPSTKGNLYIFHSVWKMDKMVQLPTPFLIQSNRSHWYSLK